MEWIKFECETITPMFLAGADGSTPEIRAASIKGALRFWWRAMNGHLPIKELHDKEAEIFGGSGSGQGKSKVVIKSLNLTHNQISRDKLPNHPIIVNSKGRNFPINILEYLAYGTYDYIKGQNNVFNRCYFVTGSCFNVQFGFHRSLIESQKNEVINSFLILSEFGALGSRSRNGYGCFKIKNNIFDIDVNYFQENLPKYSAFSSITKLWQTAEYSKWDEALAELGKAYRQARTRLEERHKFDKRQFIAAPIEVKQEGGLKSTLERHSKPYFLNIRETEDGKYYGQIIFLPGEYSIGLELDSKKRKIDQEQVNTKFLETTKLFNNLLTDYIEEVNI